MFPIVKLAIVGSTSLAGREDVYRVIHFALVHSGAELLISGGAEGVDTMAAEVATMLGIAVHEHLPEGRGWRFYQPRNLKIAQECDHLVRLVAHDSKTYGSGWTRDRAKEMGKPTNETVFPEYDPDVRWWPIVPPFWTPYDASHIPVSQQVKLVRG